MEQNDSLELLKSFINQTVENIEYVQDEDESLLKISFTNNESFIITADAFDMYFAMPKDTEFH
jgi:archaellum component FlaF (FlaF/FlaG flagellin family)